MKKIICSFVLLVCIIGFIGNVNAYSTSSYSIDIPSTYRKAVEGSFTKENGNNVNVQIVPFSSSSSKPFTEEKLNSIVESINSNIEAMRGELKKTIKERYGEYISESEIEKYANSFKCDSIDKKEITTATKNNYKCYHLIMSYSSGDYKTYTEQYSFLSNNNIYTLSVTVNDKNDLQSLEVKNIINSFTISNYKDPENSSFFSDELISRMIMAGMVPIILGLIAGGIKIFSNKKDDKQQEEIKNEPEKKEEKIEDKSDEIEEIKNEKVVKEDKRYCTKCGNEIKEEWDFCNNCGNKLK